VCIRDKRRSPEEGFTLVCVFVLRGVLVIWDDSVCICARVYAKDCVFLKMPSSCNVAGGCGLQRGGKKGKQKQTNTHTHEIAIVYHRSECQDNVHTHTLANANANANTNNYNLALHWYNFPILEIQMSAFIHLC
jgi:hypothetical protein